MGLQTAIDAARFFRQQQTHRLRTLPIVIVYLNNVCDSQCITCSIWKNNGFLKIPSERHMTESLLDDLYGSLPSWRPRQILLSGGEPVLHPKFGEVVRRFCAIAPKVCVITNGLLLRTCDPTILESVSEFYISFDAPDSEAYRKIRGVDGFGRLADSMRSLTSLSHRPKAVARCTLQRENIRRIPQLIAAAQEFGFDAISFLGADISSEAFSRDVHGAADRPSIQPTSEDMEVMEGDILRIKTSGAHAFVEGGVEKLERLLQYFRALAGLAGFPAVACNAPWASMVIETTGQIRGCFFQPIIGDFQNVNGDAAVRFRKHLKVDQDPTCRRCVCSKWLGLGDLARMR
jgi:Fe-coproporphyrin III synthase